MYTFSCFRYAKSTEAKCDWAVRIFNDWKARRNATAIRDKSRNLSVMRSELLEMTKDELSYCLSRFVLEIQNQSGQDYPAETLYEIIIAIQLHLTMNGRTLKLLQDDDFLSLKNCLDNRMKQLAGEGKKVQRKQAEVITIEEENGMWEKKSSVTSPRNS